MSIFSQRLCAILLLVLPTRLVRWAVNRLGHFNRCAGPIRIALGNHAHLGHFNTVTRARFIGGPATALTLGDTAKITSRHRVDLTCPISIGDFSTVAGTGSQLWTHGYVHAMDGPGRYRIDGPIVIEDNVYVGSMTFISMGVRIARGVIVGGGSAVGKSLLEPGLYVSGPLRHMARPPDPETREDLTPLERRPFEDIVYRKRLD
jgi:acetyltransferase-like isoleucine patch superfamily enzyme